MKKKKKLAGYKIFQAIQASIQNKVTGKRGTRVTAGGITCSNVARNGNSKQEGIRLQQWQQQQTPPVMSAVGRETAVNTLLITLH
jgi:hypothetical protein